MTRRVTDGLIIATLLALGATHLWTRGFGGHKVVRPHQAGGATGSVVRAGAAPNRGVVIGAHRFTGDGRGAAAGGSAQVVREPGGAQGAHTGRWSRAAGSATSSGVSHSATCADASGQVAACGK